MKTLVGKIVSLAAVASAASLAVFAAAPTLDNGMSRDLNHLTLLKGPNLISPARPVSTADPMVTFEAPSPTVGTFRFVPPPTPDTGAVHQTSPGTPAPRKTEEPAASSTEPSPAQKKPLPAPDTLHFNSKLHPTPTRGTMERVREP
jgi:hypothetical protein